MEHFVLIKGASPNNNDEQATVKVPVVCNVRLVKARKSNPVRAYASIEYAGIVINNIEIHENRGEFQVVYPKQTFTRKNGNEGFITLAHPSGSLGRTINHIILNAYSNAIVGEEYAGFFG